MTYLLVYTLYRGNHRHIKQHKQTNSINCSTCVVEIAIILLHYNNIFNNNNNSLLLLIAERATISNNIIGNIILLVF